MGYRRCTYFDQVTITDVMKRKGAEFILGPFSFPIEDFNQSLVLPEPDRSLFLQS